MYNKQENNMKIEPKGVQAITTGLESNRFNLEVNSKIYDMLLTKLYKNKEGAVIRELACNAWDSHIEAGNQATPFDMQIPTWLDRTFFIRDYGTGIPHDKFEGIYTNIGFSTKEGTNELTGGFGIGNKSAFCLTDSFNVENIYEGTKTIWVCFMDAGIPSVSKVATMATDEPSGLKVSFTYEGESIAQFEAEIPKQLRYFPVKPTVIGSDDIQWPEFPEGWEDKEYFYNKDEGTSWNRKHYVVMGNVSYVLESGDVDYEYNNIFRSSLTLKVNMGDVDIPPSRENLEFTPKTKAKLNAMLRNIRDTYALEFLKSIEDAESFLELRKIVFQCNRTLLGKKLPTDIEFEGKTHTYYELAKHGFRPRNGMTTKSMHTSYVQQYRASDPTMPRMIDGTYTFYLNDLGKGHLKHINQESHKIPDSAMIIDPPSFVKKTRDGVIAKATEDAKEHYELSDIKMLSSILGFPVMSKGNTGKTKPNQYFTLAGNYDTLKSSLRTYDGDIPTDGYCIPISGWSVIEADTFSQSITLISRLGVMSGDINDIINKVYFVRAGSVKEVKDNLKDSKALYRDLSKKVIPILNKDREILQKKENMPVMHKLSKFDWSQTGITCIPKLLKYRGILDEKEVSYHLVDTILPLFCDDRRLKNPKGLHSKTIDKYITTYKEVYKGLIDQIYHGWRTEQTIEAFIEYTIKTK